MEMVKKIFDFAHIIADITKLNWESIKNDGSK